MAIDVRLREERSTIFGSLRDHALSLPEMIPSVLPAYIEEVARLFHHWNPEKIKRIYIFGCGDSNFVGQLVKSFIESNVGTPVEVYTSLEFSRYVVNSVPKDIVEDALAIGISVSGSVVRTQEGIQRARAHGIHTLALTSKFSKFTELSEDYLLCDIPPFDDNEPNGTPGIRSFVCNYLMLLIFSIQLGRIKRLYTDSEVDYRLDTLLSLGKKLSDFIISSETKIDLLSSNWIDANEYVFVGSGPNYGSAKFCAAKLIEASGDFTVAQETEEWAHLNYYNRKKDTPTIILSSGGCDLSRTKEVVNAALDIGRQVLLIAPAMITDQFKSCLSLSFVDDCPEWASSLFSCVFGALYASNRSVLLNETYFRENNTLSISKIRTSEMLE